MLLDQEPESKPVVIAKNQLICQNCEQLVTLQAVGSSSETELGMISPNEPMEKRYAMRMVPILVEVSKGSVTVLVMNPTDEEIFIPALEGWEFGNP